MLANHFMKFAVVSAVPLLGTVGYSAYAGGPLGRVADNVGVVTHAVTGTAGQVTSGATGGGGALGNASGVGSGLTGAGGGGGSRSSGKGQLLPKGVADQQNAIKANLVILSKKELVKFCNSVGAGFRCSTASRDGLIGLIAARKIKCHEVVNSPGKYEYSLVKLCRLVRG